ncbi:MAG: YjbH domain-containing protein [Bacteroidales bacterium]|nr:YjbH domain-containing protein [Bacteroidales bacterium]
MRSRALCIIFLLLSCLSARAQFNDCTTGLLQMASAEMDDTGVFTVTNNFLNQNALPKYYGKAGVGWYYNSFGYGVGITFFSRLELVYAMVIFDEKHHPYPGQEYRSKIFFNQDRHFAAKFLAFREGKLFKWMPAVAFGISDPVSAVGGGYFSGKIGQSGNGFFNRIYVVATKHFDTPWGEAAAHAGYQYSPRIDYDRKGPIAAVSFRPSILENRWFYPKFILEYDARTVNFGFIASVWDGRFEAMFDLQNFQWINFGLRFKLHLAGTENVPITD